MFSFQVPFSRTVVLRGDFSPTPGRQQVSIVGAQWVEALASKPEDMNSIPGSAGRRKPTPESYFSVELHIVTQAQVPSVLWLCYTCG